MNPATLAARLRWLARTWEEADGPLQERIERAFRNGYARGMKV